MVCNRNKVMKRCLSGFANFLFLDHRKLFTAIFNYDPSTCIESDVYVYSKIGLKSN